MSENGAGKIYNLCSAYPDYTVLLAFGAIGDICYCLYALKAVKELHGKKILVITNGKNAPVVSAFKGVNKTVVLREEESKIFSEAAQDEEFSFFKVTDVSKSVFNCGALKESEYRKFIKAEGETINLNEIIRRSFERKGVAFKPTLPSVNADITRFSGLDFKNTVIINPYSNSMKIGSASLFQDMADELRGRNFTVFTNVTGEQQPLINTHALKCSTTELYMLSQKVKSFISIRSGIVDFCISSGGNFKIYYTDMWDGLFKKAYCLKGWQSGSKVEELGLLKR